MTTPLSGFVPFGPFGPAGWLLEHLSKRAGGLFGAGGRVILPQPPQRTPQKLPDGQGPAQEEIERVTSVLAAMQKQLDELHKAGEKAAEDAGANSDDGRLRSDQILGEGGLLGSGLDAQGATPEANAGRMSALQQQVDELAKNVQDKANTANGIADSLRNMGMGMPGLGMPGGLGGAPGLGMPAGLSPLGGSGLGAPAPVSAADSDVLKPAAVSTLGDDALKPAPVHDPNAPVAAPADATGIGAGAAPAENAAGAGTAVPAAASGAGAKPAEATTAGKEITLPGGQVVSARSPEAAQAVRNALEKPVGTGDMASAAYEGTGVEIPTDGADPGRKVDPADVKPGDIAVCDDHTAIVAGNGQLIGPDGQLQPLGVINDWQGFKGFFDPTAPADSESTASVPAAAAPVSPPLTTGGTDSDTTVMAAGPPRTPATAGTTSTRGKADS